MYIIILIFMFSVVTRHILTFETKKKLIKSSILRVVTAVSRYWFLIQN